MGKIDPSTLKEVVAAKRKLLLERNKRNSKPKQLPLPYDHNAKLKRPRWLGWGELLGEDELN